MWPRLSFLLLLLAQSVFSAIDPSQDPAPPPPGSPPDPPPGQQVMHKVYYSTKGMASKPKAGTKDLACGIFIQTDKPKPGNGIQLEVKPNNEAQRALIFSQRNAVAAPYGAVGRKYQSGLVAETDLRQALRAAMLEPIKAADHRDIWTKINCINWSMSLADDLHTRGLMRNTDFSKLSNLMNQWNIATLPMMVAIPGAWAWYKWGYKKWRAQKLAGLKGAAAHAKTMQDGKLIKPDRFTHMSSEPEGPARPPGRGKGAFSSMKGKMASAVGWKKEPLRVGAGAHPGGGAENTEGNAGHGAIDTQSSNGGLSRFSVSEATDHTAIRPHPI